MLWIGPPCNHGNVMLTSVFICVLANQLPLRHTLSLLNLLCVLWSSLKEAVCLKGAGLSAISHHLTDSSIWYTDSICCALQATILITHTDAPAHLRTRLCACMWRHVCVCVFTPSSLLSCLSGVLFSSGPILSSISCPPCLRLCAPENERGMSLALSHWYSALKT